MRAMSDSVSSGGFSGSGGVLSSTMRSITRQAGDPQDREARRVEDVVDLTPAAANQEQSQRQIEPAEPGDSLRNPGSQKAPMAGQNAEKEAQEAEAAAREASEAQQAQTFEINRPVNIGMAAAINIGTDDMVRRFDTNGDEHLDKVEREQAIRAVQSERGGKPGGGRMFRSVGESDESSGGDGAAFLAEKEAQKARTEQSQAEAQSKAERARAERIAALEEQQAKAEAMAETTAQPTAGVPRRPDAGAAYQKSDSLGGPPPKSVDA
jgi:hypothetical protein